MGSYECVDVNSGHDVAGRDTRDAAQVPPSVLAQSLGEPVIAHDDPNSAHATRHGSTSYH